MTHYVAFHLDLHCLERVYSFQNHISAVLASSLTLCMLGIFHAFHVCLFFSCFFLTADAQIDLYL